MTDEEILNWCAKAVSDDTSDVDGHLMFCGMLFAPLVDDAQAMALVKKFNMRIYEPSKYYWRAAIPNEQIGLAFISNEQDLNRAICECVAMMQRAK